MSRAFADRVRHVLETEAANPAMHFAGAWLEWSQFAAGAQAVERLLVASDVAANVSMAIVLRNRPASAAGLLALLAHERTAVLISSVQPAASLAREIQALRPAILLAETQDWTDTLISAAKTMGTLGVELADAQAPGARLVAGLEKVQAGEHYFAGDHAAIVLPTSGTTGPSKRIPLTWSWLDDYLPKDQREIPVEKRRAIIIAAPLVTITGLAPFLSWATRPLKLALMERLDVKAWAELVREHKPKLGGLPPAAMHMMLDADIDPEALSSLEGWYTGSAPLHPAVAEAFERRFNLPVLIAYGATEFGGAVASWTLSDHRRFAAEKRGSTGRANLGCELRVVDPETHAVLPPNSSGLLEVRTPKAAVPASDGWVRTNDLARIDEDGFLFIEGRADDVIIRGGFKVPLIEVESALQEHPAVRQAAGLGLPDERLGQVPAAAATLRPGATPPTEADLIAWCRERLAPYKVPVVLKLVDELPMNASMKVSRPLLREILSEARSSTGLGGPAGIDDLARLNPGV